jgi:NADPH:quinone reductase-like Zn-dependent oxidoreductase
VCAFVGSQEYWRQPGSYDRVLDLVANRPLSDFVGLLAAEGMYQAVSLGKTTSEMLARASGMKWLSWRAAPKQFRAVVGEPTPELLEGLRAALEAGTLQVVVGRHFNGGLEDIPAAMHLQGSPHRPHGKIVVSVVTAASAAPAAVTDPVPSVAASSPEAGAGRA